jgi:TP901 family phage tail tape measure protein
MPTERIVIFVNEKGTRRVIRGLRGVGAAGAKAQGQVASLNTALVALGGALALRSAIGLLADFGQEMSTVRAITGATAEEFTGLRNIARELGATTRFSATEAAQGLSFLARAGFDASEAIETIDDTLNLAQAGALDLGSAADIASNVLRGFRLQTDQAGRVVDVLALAANKSNTNVQQLGDALKFVAPVAAGVGVDIEETTAAISALSDAGLQASLAGTGLRRILSELESPAAKSQKLLRELGLTADDVRVSQVGLTTALDRLARSGIDTGRALKIFGDRGGPAFEVLREAVRDGTITKMESQLDKAGGTAERVARIMDDNLNGALLALKSAAQEVMLSLGDMNGSANVLEKVVRGLADALRFLGQNIEIVAGVITVLMIPAVKTLFGFIAAHPVGLLIVALGAAVGSLIAFKNEIRVTSDGLVTLGDLMSESWETVINLLSDAVRWWSDLFGGVEDDITGLQDDVKLPLENILLFFARTFDRITGLARGMVAAIIRAVQFLADEIKNDLSGVITDALLLGRKRAPGVDLPPQLFARLGFPAQQFKAMERRQRSQIKPIGERLGEAMGEAFKIGFQKTPLEDLTKGLFEGARERAKQRQREAAFEVAPRAGGMIGTALGGPLGGALGAGVETLGRVFAQTEAGQKVFEVAEKGASAIGNFAENLKNANTEAAETPGFLDGMSEAMAQLNASTLALGQNVGDRLVSAFDDATGALADFAATGFQNVDDLKQAFSDLFSSLGRDILQLILKTLILKAIGGELGGTDSGSGIAGLFGGIIGVGGGKQAGGGVIADRPTVVGERGPEVFVPPSSGTIVPNHKLGGASEVSVTVVNVDNEESIPRAMNGPAGDNVILNSIERNPEAVKGVLGL